MNIKRAFDPGTKTGRLRSWALDALRRHDRDGLLPTSLRHLFYEAVMAGVVAKEQNGARRPDQDLTAAVTWLREHDYVPWAWIQDRTRHLSDYRGHAPTVREGVAAMLDGIRIDPWPNVQPVLVVESEATAGVLVPQARRDRVLIVPTRGQSNGWLRTAVAGAFAGDRSLAVGYLGDADKAGDDIEANTLKVLSEVADITTWERLALTWAQVEEHGLPTVWRKDGRDRKTRRVCETEALPQGPLVEAVGQFLARHRVEPLADVLEREAAQRQEIRDLLER